jgi:hypothetical protein
MRSLSLWLLPMTLLAGQARYARVGDFDGNVEVQIRAADAWEPALRNMPLGELAWLRTEGSSRVEVELDDGSVLRLGGDSLAELSDYTRLSTGQRITLISLDHGLAYFSGAAQGRDALMLAVPGAQVTIHRGAHLRLEAREQWSQIAAGDGAARFSSPTAEFDLEEGQMARIDPAHPARFYLYREISPLDTDRWNGERDKVLASTASAGHLPQLHYGVSDLDANGVWIQSGDFGAVWKPKMPAAWAPFRDGKWRWYDGLGYTWVSNDAWGWLPYHYGRWIQQEDTGWVWAPGKNTAFKPGEVYWLRTDKLVGWGPLAPGEEWKPPVVPRLFLNANTTYATFTPEAPVIDPASFPVRPQEPLASAMFMAAMPSPAFPASRLEAFRPVLHAGSTRVVPILDGVTFEGPADSAGAHSQAARAMPSTPVGYLNPPPAAQPIVIVTNPPAPPLDPTYYAVPVYTGIIVVAPPKRKGVPPAKPLDPEKPK